MESRILKERGELQICYWCSNREGVALPNFEDRISEELGEMRTEIGMNGTPDNGIPTEKLRYITAPLSDPWPTKLQQTMWMEEDNGAIIALPNEEVVLGGDSRDPTSDGPDSIMHGSDRLHRKHSYRAVRMEALMAHSRIQRLFMWRMNNGSRTRDQIESSPDLKEL
jgi:hypothetical protein